MERVSDIIGELEGRLGGLKEDSVKAKEYLKLRDRYKELEINITLKNIENLELKNEYIKDDIMELQVLIDDAEEKRKQLESQLSQCSDRSGILEEISTETRQKLLAAIDELNAAVNKGQLDRERLLSIEENTQRIRSEIKLLEEKKEREEDSGKE